MRAVRVREGGTEVFEERRGVSVADRLSAMIVANPDAKRIVLSTRLFYELRRSVPWGMLYVQAVSDEMLFEGLPIVRVRPSIFCRNCGAPIEPMECSYCKTPSEIIELEH